MQFNCLAALQDLRARNLPCQPAQKLLWGNEGVQTRDRMASPGPTNHSVGFYGSLGKGVNISINLVCPTLEGLLTICIFGSSSASFHSASSRRQVLATAWSSIWLMETHSPGTYWCLTAVSSRMTAGPGRCAQPAKHSVWSALSRPPRKLSPLQSACEALLCEGSYPPTSKKWSPIRDHLNRESKVLWIFPIKD